MSLGKGSIDLVLVPSGLLLMFGYHLILLYRVLRLPQTTTIGFENHNKKAWVDGMLRGGSSGAELGLGVISASISASSTLASLSIGLSSLIGAWVGNSSKLFVPQLFYGDDSLSTNSVKYLSLLACFLAAFTSFVQATRYFVHASFLITTLDSDVPMSYVETAVIRGGNFFTVGLRLLYLAATLLLWVFGPIPMFASSLGIVITLSIFDTNTTPLHNFRHSSSGKKESKTPDVGASQAMHASSSYAKSPMYTTPSIMSG
ncbi:hypothetical protein Taro_035910 [Colocasia esculenta]|uniref:Uncharacterized protein n=1 Tax=Colocasia esculenta TaxID=4460 RepID=A0A843W1N4_COLES|nr:hypothetical protein [Colocasia esculenta]